MNLDIPKEWGDLLKDELEASYFNNLLEFVEAEYATAEVFPPMGDVFRAFELCPPQSVKVVIIGQDPYHGDGQAHGLSFSVRDGVKFPPSLRNIFKELHDDIGVEIPTTGNLENWARQGVLLLNAVLTVRAHSAASHAGKGWERFTDGVVAALGRERSGIVYILWGGYAQKKGAKIDAAKNHIINGHHPSPLSAYRGFFGSKPFSQCNEYLISIGAEKVNW
ncbi:MAG: uracil-DNA glycosylase [Rikenellaceae bacterium]